METTIIDIYERISMNMRDGTTGKLVWESSAWGPDMFETELKGEYYIVLFIRQNVIAFIEIKSLSFIV